jgi:ferredoxin-NADP reductase
MISCVPNHHFTMKKLSSASVFVAAAWIGTVAAFRPSVISPKFSTRLFAEGGAPQYQKHEAILERVENVGKGSYLLSVKYSNDYGDEAKYQPGNVLALEIQPPSDVMKASPSSIDEYTTMNEKTERDMNDNEGWLRGPYTVSRGLGDGEGFQILIKQVGYKSNVMATAAPNTPVRFGGKFKVPIAEGILNNLDLDGKNPAERVVLVSTGVGVGPCVGAVELLLKDKDSSFRGKIDLLASFRTKEEIAMADDLETLAAAYPERFEWKPIITREVGRISKSAESLESFLTSRDSICAVQNTHYHLIGNGQLVNEWKAGLEKAGVPKERVTLEAYFNHSAEADSSAIDNIASTVQKLELQEAELAR